MKLSSSRTLIRAKRDRLSRTIRVLKFTAFLILSVCLQANAGIVGHEINKSPFAYIDISGTVKDDKGEPVVGASIVVKGTTIGTSTDAAGNFKLQLTEQRVVLVISSVGYQTQEVIVSTSGPVNITLIGRGDMN